MKNKRKQGDLRAAWASVYSAPPPMHRTGAPGRLIKRRGERDESLESAMDFPGFMDLTCEYMEEAA
jgi:hypothetical protein